ncbi:protein CELLULOSE SYNTHASE INTERACTIVE 1-like [Cynara cardunculus var. scolymus]|uniref:Armadillo n=1 Tax=Cynara cardunculus var. scolymus TaxID=59895 RepID=A0A103Y3V5_CYNCS|nr:protein CELLULOSE SYNTHASE INTERACTIVE 1-like [Cynara cardunculus var. scolymus]KVI02046.1 Armadillo [Cynara cardunculus var. scolymus]
MHYSPPPPPPPPSSAHTLNQTTALLSILLPATFSVKSFIARWQVIRSKLAILKSSLYDISESTHWSENPLLQTLLPGLLSTLRRIQTLCDQCTDSNCTAGKLLMQSDLDMAAGWLSKQLDDLDLLIRSGVLCQSTAIVLSQPAPGSSIEDLGFFIRDLFTRLQIGGVEFKRKAMECLLQLLVDDENAVTVVASEGNIRYLVHLLDVDDHREQAVSAVSLLACASEHSRKTVFEEGGLGPLLRILEFGSISSKEKASVAIEAITGDIHNAWAISAYGGVPILLDVCRSGSLTAQSHAIGAIRNVASAEDIRSCLCEEDAVAVIVQLLVSGSAAAQEKAANCIAIVTSSSKYFGTLLIQEKGLERLLHLLHRSSNPDTLEYVLRSIHSLSTSDSVCRLLSSSSTFIIQIAELIDHGNLTLQQISASILAKLFINDCNKRAVAGCMGSLVKLMEFVKPVGLQEAAMQALTSLLTVKQNRSYFTKDEKSMTSLVQMLDPLTESVPKKFPVAVVYALMAGGSNSRRKRLVDAGAHNYLQLLSEMEVVGAKKALQRLSGSRLKSIFTRTWRE